MLEMPKETRCQYKHNAPKSVAKTLFHLIGMIKSEGIFAVLWIITIYLSSYITAPVVV